MNNPNPFVPQGSLLEQEKRRSRMKLAVFCVLAIGVCGLTAMLIQGCKRENTEADNTPPVDTNTVATADTNNPPMDNSNATAYVPPVMTNPPVVVPTPVEPTESEYVIVKGDTLGKVAKAHGISLKALEAANPNVQPTKLKVGDKIMIPAGTSSATATPTMGATTSADTGEEIYKVKSGDTLTKIAKANGTTVKAIESENNLSTTKIKVGQKLKIPAKAEAPNTVVNMPPATVPTPAPVAPAPASSATPAH
ncbi:MAG TPA: LysM peptidoglycan-binding domain-containing protein [Verrucomicrobiae bacterium]|jgi:LysM repeat protein|nr:LysM peptidoglycan-binding domain-containing protein [Verrucomicrobiae bacterium]